jgi:uncharacterized Zn finger protein
MAVEPFADQVWDRVIGALARQAIYTAKLLAGDLPAEVVQLCDSAEAHLFPGHPDDIVMRCSCPEWAVPCKHVAAVHYAFAAELDRDPFLLEIDALNFEIHPPEVPGAVLRLLGTPPGWAARDDLADVLQDLYQVASASVRDAALADLDEDEASVAEPER